MRIDLSAGVRGTVSGDRAAATMAAVSASASGAAAAVVEAVLTLTGADTLAVEQQ